MLVLLEWVASLIAVAPNPATAQPSPTTPPVDGCSSVMQAAGYSLFYMAEGGDAGFQSFAQAACSRDWAAVATAAESNGL